jgi:aminoglycoside/choline kinase family phosphotransferase
MSAAMAAPDIQHSNSGMARSRVFKTLSDTVFPDIHNGWPPTGTTVLINWRIVHEHPWRTRLHRLEQLHAWLVATLPGRRFELAPASADASFRRYFRVSLADGAPSLIVMDAPPTHEDCRPWLHVADLFRAAGAHVPDVLAQDIEQGFLLLSDLGSTTYLAALQADGARADDPQRAAHLYADALGTLAAIQVASRPGELPEYDRALLLREMMLFPEWYIARHKGVVLSDKDNAALQTTFERILAVNLAEPKVFVHRDFHSRNLMLLDPADGCGANPGVIDFQDAVYGPITYDLVSLLKDAYIRWDEEFALDLLVRYWETARTLGLPVRADFADFHRDYEWMGVQRHIKVLGIFARLYHRDGKDGYLADMPLVMDYLRRACKRYRDLGPLLKLLDRLEPEALQVGYTF